MIPISEKKRILEYIYILFDLHLRFFKFYLGVYEFWLMPYTEYGSPYTVVHLHSTLHNTLHCTAKTLLLKI